MKEVYAFLTIVAAIVVFVLWQLVVPFTGNKNNFDTTYRFDQAIISMPDGSVVKGKVDSWTDYESDAIQIKIGGKTYLTHYSNAVLIAE
jgi:hypothetical protein